MGEKSYLGKGIERVIFVLIALGVGLIFFEEYANYRVYPPAIKRYIIAGNLFFDFAFTVEFIARIFKSSSKGGTGRYMVYEGGLIDFFSSIPLLLFYSSPMFFSLFTSQQLGILPAIGIFRFLKTAKMIRVARALRVIRALKFLGRVKKRYFMTPRYIARAITLSTGALILILMGFSYSFSERVFSPEAKEINNMLASYIKNYPEIETGDVLINLASGSDKVLMIEWSGEIIYKKQGLESIEDNFMPYEYTSQVIGDYKIYYSLLDTSVGLSYVNLLVFSGIILIIILFSTLYRAFFNKHITKPATCMLRGFKTISFNTATPIHERFSDFEIYKLAEQYNKKWLPLKKRLLELKRQNEYNKKNNNIS